MSTPVQTAVGAFVWHDYGSTDPEKGQRFYTELFGWKTEERRDIDYTAIVADGKQHGGFWPAGPAEAPPQWVGHVLVKDVDETAARAEAAGGSLLFGGPMDAPEGRRFAGIRDPEGAAFSAYSSPADETPPPGVFVWDELYVDDIEAAKSFYSEVLGWTTSDTEMENVGTYTIFNSGDQQRAGAMKKPGAMPSHWLVYIQTADVDRDAAKAKELGAQVFMEPFDVPTVGRLAICADPLGAPFGLFKGEQ
jgi:predicted enzyme related to lactoylglutathione lyase